MGTLPQWESLNFLVVVVRYLASSGSVFQTSAAMKWTSEAVYLTFQLYLMDKETKSREMQWSLPHQRAEPGHRTLGPQ